MQARVVQWQFQLILTAEWPSAKAEVAECVGCGHRGHSQSRIRCLRYSSLMCLRKSVFEFVVSTKSRCDVRLLAESSHANMQIHSSYRIELYFIITFVGL